MQRRQDEPVILVGGGSRDPNIRVLLKTLEAQPCRVMATLVGDGHDPGVSWDVDGDRLVLNGRPIRPQAAFVRHDVFTHTEDGRASFRAFAWYTTLMGWIMTHEDVRCFNRQALGRLTNKPHLLCLAKKVGLRVPETRVTNELGSGEQDGSWDGYVAKPVGGGGYCQRISAIWSETELRKGVAAAPAIVQRELVGPEVRVFGIGKEMFAFRVVSDALDYRTDPGVRVEWQSEVPEEIGQGLGQLMEMTGLDFAAADFKTDKKTGKLMFLEINNGPMFAAFDQAAEGRISKAMVRFLARGTTSLMSPTG